MGRELRPPEDALAVPVAPVFEVVRLVGVAEGVEARILYLLHARGHLLRAEGVALPELVLIFAHAVEEHRLPVEVEPPVAVLALYGPAQGAETEGSGQFVGRLPPSLDEGGEAI